MWTVRLITYCWPVYHSQPLEQLWLLQCSKLQIAKIVVKISVVQVCNIPRDSQLCMGKYKAYTWMCYRTGKFKQVYGKLKLKLFNWVIHVAYIHYMTIFSSLSANFPPHYHTILCPHIKLVHSTSTNTTNRWSKCSYCVCTFTYHDSFEHYIWQILRELAH